MAIDLKKEDYFFDGENYIPRPEINDGSASAEYADHENKGQPVSAEKEKLYPYELYPNEEKKHYSLGRGVNAKDIYKKVLLFVGILYILGFIGFATVFSNTVKILLHRV